MNNEITGKYHTDDEPIGIIPTFFICLFASAVVVSVVFSLLDWLFGGTVMTEVYAEIIMFFR